MNTQTVTGTIEAIKRMNNSINGNPNYKITLKTSNGVMLTIGTLNDMMENYKISHSMEGKQAVITVKVNRKSNKLLSIEA